MSHTPRLTGEILDQTARRFPDKTAVVDGGRQISYGALDQAANRVANGLIAAGYRPGERIGLLAPNCIEFAEVYFGSARAGTVLVTMSTRYTSADIAGVIDRAGVTALFLHADYADLFAAITPRPPGLKDVWLFGGPTPAGDASSYAPFDAFIAAADPAPPAVTLDPDQAFCMTLTGGTTGIPKGVVVSHRSRVLSAYSAVEAYGLTADDVVGVITPMFHIAALFVWFQPAVLAGASMVFMAKWDPVRFADLTARHGITAITTVPTQLSDLLTRDGVDITKLATLRRAIHGGAPMTPDLLNRLTAALPAIEFIDNYGQSEAGPLTALRRKQFPDKIHTVGKAMPGVELAIFDAAANPLPVGESGEVATRSRHLMLGYDNNAALTDTVFRHGREWLLTGDIGRLDEDGFLTIVDRSKDIIIVGGENIYPQEVEKALCEHPHVLECAVFGVPDDRLGEVPAAHVVLDDPGSLSEDDLIAFAMARIGRHKRPRLIVFVDSLPKTPVGKIKKNELRAPYWRDAGRQI